MSYACSVHSSQSVDHAHCHLQESWSLSLRLAVVSAGRAVELQLTVCRQIWRDLRSAALLIRSKLRPSICIVHQQRMPVLLRTCALSSVS